MVAPLFVLIDFLKMLCSCCFPFLLELKPDEEEIEIVGDAYSIGSTLRYDELGGGSDINN